METAGHHDDPKIPDVIQRDQEGTGDLPTYDDLTTQHANEPNSRFGRWRSWIGKRAAERYAETSLDDYEQRRARGWDLSDPPTVVEEPPTPSPSTDTGAHSFPPNLHLNTDFSHGPPPPPPKDWTPRSQNGDPFNDTNLPEYAHQAGGPVLPTESLAPSHLLLNNFGSRFIPHAQAPIRCLLPLPLERLLLIGTDDGLSVLNLYPTEWAENGLIQKGPNDAQARVIWEGEGILQMSLVECEPSGEQSVNGVVLALVGGGPMSPRDTEGHRVIRMYNLSSLISLAKWAVSGRMTHPLDLRRPSGWQQQETPKKKHGRHASIAKGLKSLILESPIAERASQSLASARFTPPGQISQRNVTPAGTEEKPGARLRPVRDDSNDSVNSWDVVDDLPLRWATDYVALASPGSRLSSSSVLSYDIRLNDDRRSRGGALLAIATKTNILMYETPKGQRAFRFVKEFYTPLPPRSVTFVHQAVGNQSVSPSMDSNRPPHLLHSRSPSDSTSATLSYSAQLSLFVVFDKKAGIIRIADSAVGELELYAASDRDSAAFPSMPSWESGHLGSSLSTSSSGSFGHRSRASSVGNFRQPSKGAWLHPIQVDIPSALGAADHGHLAPMTPGDTSMYLLTRGKATHVLPYPLPATLNTRPPVRILQWSTAPNHIAVRINHTSHVYGNIPFLQVIAFTEDGLEIQELDVDAVLGRTSRKGKDRATEPLYAQADLGGEAGFLCVGGHWQRTPDVRLARAFSVASNASATSFDTLDSEQANAKLAMEQGIYGWVRKGLEDYRIFWVGGTGKEDTDGDLYA